MELAPYAMQVTASRGRRYTEPPHPYRNEYARDRDRVIHSRAFRRLEAKTQVFTRRFSDHFRNRLTHTLEVSQIARTVAGALGLNSELAEALALVHDIGHPPFGHAGENRLDALMREHGDRFDHNLHALRIVDQFEQRYLEFPGLNLTFEVREGIVKHSREYPASDFPDLADFLLDQRPPLEAQIINLVDEIAYNTADLDDGVEANLLDQQTILDEVSVFSESFTEVERRHPYGRTKLKFNEALKRLLDQLVTDLIQTTEASIRASGVQDVEAVRRHPQRLSAFSTLAARQNAELKSFLFVRLYDTPALVEDRDRSVEALDRLFQFYCANPDRMPAYYAGLAKILPRHRVVCDYIAGMTDNFLLQQHRTLLSGSSSKAD